ncbi:MAG: hypothetical protein E4H36_08750 [Spirochaetales bacterium]|nr:MAG: hypothetical protein E4H36_08750 [Spirochaetales bacterium]
MNILATLALCVTGLLIGFLAQRSRICFIAGLRDYILVRDRELLMGLFSFVATVWVLTSACYALGLLQSGMPEFGDIRVKIQVLPVPGAEGLPGGLKPLRLLGDGSLPAPLWSIVNPFFFVTLAGGFLLGFLSVQAGGCVLRQHVLAAQGDRDSLWYLAGFYLASPVFYLVLYRLFAWVY